MAGRSTESYINQAIKAIAQEAMGLDRTRISNELQRLADIRGDNTLPLEDAISVAMHELPMRRLDGIKD